VSEDPLAGADILEIDDDIPLDVSLESLEQDETLNEETA
jgi:hypothetical protein